MRWLIFGLGSVLLGFIFTSVPVGADDRSGPRAARLPEPGSVVIDHQRGELILSARVQFPEDKPCINEFGQRVQAFAGCATAAGGDARMAGYFVFPCDCPGGIIADNRYPIYDPKPTVRFDMSKAPPVGTQVYVRIRVISSTP